MNNIKQLKLLKESNPISRRKRQPNSKAKTASRSEGGRNNKRRRNGYTNQHKQNAIGKDRRPAQTSSRKEPANRRA